ncbi:hypothetical protein DFP72DRAFT_879209 [Ephemerocybe angulata]|uniref:DUF202 domain-containing protein n=1 Tax=Ephemerocybe angulata TaxID=980116 RepID=A0A8H6I9Z4_9AGAR|nr:hypothetical protein DFP72DRAFT_879209 [Tulosesus angulatus]
MSSRTVKNTGSTARDFCMLERNLLAHFKLAMLLSVMTASLLLQARLVPEKEGQKQYQRVPLASVEFACAVVCIIAGIWEYYQGYQDLVTSRPFWGSGKVHGTLMAPVALVIFTTCIIFVVYN